MNIAREVVASVTIKIKLSIMDNDLAPEKALERLHFWPYSEHDSQVSVTECEVTNESILSVQE